MAGRYHRTYLKHDLEKAFQQMLAERQVSGNSYFVEAVRAKLEADGYLGKRSELVLPDGMEPISVRRRRRRF